MTMLSSSIGSTSSPSKQVSLKPSPGFCIKSTALQDNQHGLKGFKVFVNIAWDSQVPEPPAGSEEAIKRAMKGQDDDKLTEDSWFVPVIVSEPRPDVDKGMQVGKPSLVFDCIFHKSLKARVLLDQDFKLFLVELALQRIEVQFGILLSRTIGTPNIAAKGKLTSRTVTIPDIDYTKKHPEPVKPLIQEISSITPGRLSWTWSKDGDAIRLRIIVPNLMHSSVSDIALDLEPRRIILAVPAIPSYTLDVDLTLSDAELISRFPQSDVLSLKRQRPFMVDTATSEWHVADHTLVVIA